MKPRPMSNLLSSLAALLQVVSCLAFPTTRQTCALVQEFNIVDVVCPLFNISCFSSSTCQLLQNLGPLTSIIMHHCHSNTSSVQLNLTTVVELVTCHTWDSMLPPGTHDKRSVHIDAGASLH